jgi:(1->4)-alpha-D-glucan 1-alpha-D-glucosylmutase
MIKAIREGKEQSSWSNPNTVYEGALAHFVRSALDASRHNLFVGEFHALVASLARLGALSALSQLLLKLTVPGVPDIYQGGELWDFSLVDPDNRRPVAWNDRHRVLEQVACSTVNNVAKHWLDGREKLFIIHTVLALRRTHPQLFAEGDYQPLQVEGSSNNHLCAFARSRGELSLAVVVPRLVYRLYRGGSTADWGDTRIALPQVTWRDVFSNRRYHGVAARVPAGQLLADFPVAVLFTENRTAQR